jgi:XTP/dITP diphosphohydrolase
MKELVLATNNKHKVREIIDILGKLPLTVKSLADFKKMPEVVEDGETLAQNAVKKAMTVSMRLNTWAMADDTGLEVDYLAKAPGVYSARFAGEKCTYEDNNKKLLKLLEGVPIKERTARFRCVIAIANAEGSVELTQGSIEGYIALKPAGANGFGYDPIFVVPKYKKTFAQLSDKIKNKISHRGIAVSNAKKVIKAILSRKEDVVSNHEGCGCGGGCGGCK